jgi:hypothetical protein
MMRQFFKPSTRRFIPALPRALWTPDVLAAVAWYDAASGPIVESGGFVSQWNDKTANARHLTQGTGANQPTTGTRTLNGLNVLDFDGGDFLAKASMPATSGNFVCVMVAQLDTIDHASDGLWSLSASKDFGLVANNASQFNGSIVCVGASNPASTPLSGGPFPGPSIFVTLVRVSGLRIEAFVDGVSRASVGYIGAISGSGTFRVFSDRSAAFFPDGAVAEVLVFNTLSTTDRQKVEGYLAWKWALQNNLAVGHPYKYSPPAKGA